MTIDEYLNQDPPQRLPKGTVMLQESDVNVFCYHENIKGVIPIKICYVDIYKIPEFRYIVDPDTGILYAQDIDARSFKRSTVFKLNPVLLNLSTFTHNAN